MEGNPIWKRARFLMARGGGLHPRPPSLRARGELALFFIFDPFGSVLGRFVSGVGDLVGLFGPFFWCLFCICTGRETSGSVFPVFAPFWGPRQAQDERNKDCAGMTLRYWSPPSQPSPVEGEGTFERFMPSLELQDVSSQATVFLRERAGPERHYRDYGRDGLCGVARGKCQGNRALKIMLC